MKRLSVLLIAIMAVCAFIVPAHAGYKKEYKMSVVVGPTSGWGKGAARFAELVKEKTGGKVNVKVYFSGQLFAGKQTNEFLLLRQGIADFAFASTINWSPQVKELNLFSLPWFISKKPDRYKALDAIEYGKAGKMIKDKIDKLGVVVLAWGENGFREITNSKKPIKTPEDMVGMKFRVVGSPIFLDIFKALGANPVNMNWGEAVTAFQQGVVDGQENPINSVIIPYKVYEFHKYLTEWHYVVDPLLLAVNKRTWKSFEPKVQDAVKEAALDVEKYQKALARVGLDDGSSLAYLKKINEVPSVVNPYEFLKKHGMHITKLTHEDINKFREKTKPVLEKWTKKVGKKLVDTADKDMDSVKY